MSNNDWGSGYNTGMRDFIITFVVFCLLWILFLPVTGYIDRHPECAGMTAYDCFAMRTELDQNLRWENER